MHLQHQSREMFLPHSAELGTSLNPPFKIQMHVKIAESISPVQ